MKKTMRYVNLDDAPDLAALAEEVRRTQAPCVLRRNGEDVAVLQPIKPQRKRGDAVGADRRERDPFEAAFGAWKDVDTDRLIEDIYRDRRSAGEPPEAR